MFDLFKKDEINALKAEITRLEEENRKLLLRLEKRDEKAKKTVATKQEVDRELNEAMQRVSSLESEMQKLKKETSSELKFRFSENMSRNRFEDILSLLGSLQSVTSTLMAVYLAKDDALKDMAKDVVSRIDSSDLYLIEKIDSSTGKVIFYDTDRIIKLVVIPAFPITRSDYSLDRHFNIEPLKKSLAGEKALVVNAHAGETFIGIIEADTFVEHEIIRSSVMGKHSKGGWSQKRFQSLVEEDVRHHTDKVREALLPLVGRHKDIRYVIAGGEGKLVKMVTEGYEYPLIMKSLEAVSKKNAEQVLREVMAVRVYGI
ncbi:Peptide chain release factor subunit 1 [uncultured archaeon]|nr:Peptide chain release factor subunit 1 [uncultured archaeon]